MIFASVWWAVRAVEWESREKNLIYELETYGFLLPAVACVKWGWKSGALIGGDKSLLFVEIDFLPRAVLHLVSKRKASKLKLLLIPIRQLHSCQLRWRSQHSERAKVLHDETLIDVCHLSVLEICWFWSSSASLCFFFRFFYAISSRKTCLPRWLIRLGVWPLGKTHHSTQEINGFTMIDSYITKIWGLTRKKTAPASGSSTKAENNKKLLMLQISESMKLWWKCDWLYLGRPRGSCGKIRCKKGEKNPREKIYK